MGVHPPAFRMERMKRRILTSDPNWTDGRRLRRRCLWLKIAMAKSKGRRMIRAGYPTKS
jgi:hypothetical protein